MSRFPVDVDFDIIWNKSLKEGMLFGAELFNSAVVAPTSGSATIAGISLTPIQAGVLKSATFSLTKGYGVVQLQMYTGPNNGNFSLRTPLNNSAASLTTECVLVPGSNIFGFLQAGDNTTSLSASIMLALNRVTADFNYNAKKVILWVGDSITLGSTMGSTTYTGNTSELTATRVTDHFAFQVRNYLQERGIDCRLIIKAMGGYTSRQIGYHIDQGYLDVDQADVIFYQLGVNDATTGTTDQQFLDELRRLLSWRNRKFPKAKIVLVGPTPLNNNTNETRLDQLRLIMQNFSNDAVNFDYITLATAFDRSVISNYTSSDGVHPNIASNLLVGNTLKNWINTNNFKF